MQRVPNGGVMLPAGDKIVETVREKRFARWDAFDSRKKYKIYDMMRQIGDKLTIVFPGDTRIRKNGISKSITDYSKRTGKVIEIVYYSKYLVEIEFTGVV